MRGPEGGDLPKVIQQVHNTIPAGLRELLCSDIVNPSTRTEGRGRPWLGLHMYTLAHLQWPPREVTRLL